MDGSSHDRTIRILQAVVFFLLLFAAMASHVLELRDPLRAPAYPPAAEQR